MRNTGKGNNPPDIWKLPDGVSIISLFENNLFIGNLNSISNLFRHIYAMISHVVMWQLKDEAEGASKNDNARLIKQKLETLSSDLDEIEFLEVGINETDDPQACDVVLIAEFNSEEDMKTYAQHPRHLEVVEFIKAVTTSRHVVDYNQ